MYKTEPMTPKPRNLILNRGLWARLTSNSIFPSAAIMSSALRPAEPMGWAAGALGQLLGFFGELRFWVLSFCACALEQLSKL